MTVMNTRPEKAHEKYAWILFLVIGILLIVNMMFLVFAPVSEIFEGDTGTPWAEFSEAYPDVANSYLLEQRLFYSSFLAIALFVLVLAYSGFRRGDRWTWYAMWLLPAFLVLVTILLASHNQQEIAVIYAVFAGITIIGMLMPIRKFFPQVE